MERLRSSTHGSVGGIRYCDGIDLKGQTSPPQCSKCDSPCVFPVIPPFPVHSHPRDTWVNKFSRPDYKSPFNSITCQNVQSTEIPSLRVVTANVNTLRENRKHIDAVLCSARTQCLERAFDEIGADIIGIQEGRTKLDQRKSSSLFEMFIAGHDQLGCYGVQIWVRKNNRFCFHGWRVHTPRIIEVTPVPCSLGTPTRCRPRLRCEHTPLAHACSGVHPI